MGKILQILNWTSNPGVQRNGYEMKTSRYDTEIETNKLIICGTISDHWFSEFSTQDMKSQPPTYSKIQPFTNLGKKIKINKINK